MRSRSNGGVIGAYALPTQNYANGVFFIHDAAIYNTGPNPIWPLATGVIYSATGGTISTAVDNSNYKTHTFTANGTFTVTTGSGFLEILLVGGGGCGGGLSSASAGYRAAGGGGGGGVVLVNTFVNPGTTFTVLVGAGGNPAGFVGGYINGVQSVVTSNAGHNYTALGGGAGGNYNLLNGNSGGSGGGEYGNPASATYNPGAGLQPTAANPGYGNAGGAATYASGTTATGHAGGGGGAGSAGHDSSDAMNSLAGSSGGDGWLWSRTNAYYGAGGGGGRLYPANAAISTSLIPTGLSGPYPGTITGQGGNGATTNGSTGSNYVGNNVSQSWFYGLGGGGPMSFNSAATGSNYYGGQGGPGTVIFCYRYK
jgi:hypothetical protein